MESEKNVPQWQQIEQRKNATQSININPKGWFVFHCKDIYVTMNSITSNGREWVRERDKRESINEKRLVFTVQLVGWLKYAIDMANDI